MRAEQAGEMCAAPSLASGFEMAPPKTGTSTISLAISIRRARRCACGPCVGDSRAAVSRSSLFAAEFHFSPPAIKEASARLSAQR